MAGPDTRNIALVGHGGAGKTTLAEAILFAAKMVNRQGAIGDQNTVSDFADDERRLLQHYFDGWREPFRGKLHGWRSDSPILVVDGERLVAGVCA